MTLNDYKLISLLAVEGLHHLSFFGFASRLWRTPLYRFEAPCLENSLMASS